MNDPEVKQLLDKAEELRAESEGPIEQARKLKEQGDALIAQSKELVSKRPKLL